MQFRISLFAGLAAILVHTTAGRTMDEATRDESDEMERIIGGQSATEGQFPWAAVLFYNGQFICSSSILSPRTILTAAHCVVFNGVPQPAGNFHAIAHFRKSSETVRIDFQSIQPHPNYTDSDGIQNDLAILTTTQPIPFSSTVQPVCIARKDTRNMEYKNATAMGWGNMSRKRILRRFPDELQYVSQNIVPNSICRLAYSGFEVEDTKICAGFLNGICHGDSGGPLVHLSADKRSVQIGVASYINSFFGCGFVAPGVWARVSSYFDFIMASSADRDSICVV